MSDGNSIFDRVARDIFYITTSKDPISPSQKPLIYVEDVGSSVEGSGPLSADMLAEAVLERLLLPEPEVFVVPLVNINQIPPEAIQIKLVTYLHESWQRLQEYKNISPTEKAEVENIIVRNVATGLLQKELHPTQNIPLQILWLLCEHTFEECITIMTLLAKYIMNEDGKQGLEMSICLILNNLFHETAKANLMGQKYEDLLRATLVIIKCHPVCAESVCKHRLGELTRGNSYNGTLLGKLLSLSFIPGTIGQDNDIFGDIVTEPSLLASREGMVRSRTKSLLDGLHGIFEGLLRSSAENRALCLNWLWSCVEANNARSKIMSAYASLAENELELLNTISDGFALNLELLVLRLCEPFCKQPNNSEDIAINPKILTIDPSYCAVESGPFCRAKWHEETCLMPVDENPDGTKVKRVHSNSFTFITECFFLAQKIADIGSKPCRSRLARLSQEAGRIERLLFQDSLPQEGREMASTGMKRLAAHILCYRTILADPYFIDLSSKLHSAAAQWVVQVLLDEEPYSGDRANFAPGTLKKVQFPLPGGEFDLNRPARTMQYVPELIVSNLESFITMAPRNHPEILEHNWLTWPVLTMVVALMGSPMRVRNPHLRGGLGQVLESLLPWQKGEDEMMMERRMLNMPDVSRYQRERLFVEHPFKLEIVESLLSVFVGIEVTGQDHFEQKFQYREPLYVILNHIWTIPEYRERFQELAVAAEKNMEAVNPPVFLRFSNLLINDSVFLLDEAITQMSKLREKLAEKDSGAWATLPDAQRRENEGNLELIGRIARYYNMMSKDTISILQMLTSKIYSLFCHPTMVDRLAAMLNYFLVRLTGPKSKELKVHNMKEFSFEPAVLVLEIAKIYINLGHNEDFCAGVSRDGRSYSDQLFLKTQNVLARVGGGDLLPDLNSVAQKVALHAVRQSCEEELLAEAPDEFLDPITAAIMMDPVILPSTGVSIDRPVIARHLLSDQTDPFNRSPLTMEQIKPNVELKAKIQAWIAERKATVSTSTEDSSE